MEKRFALALALSMAILFVWWQAFPPPPAPVPEAQVETNVRPQPPDTKPARVAGPETAAPVPAATERRPEERAVLDTPDAFFELSSWGASLRELRPKELKFLDRRNDPASGIRLVSAASPETSPLRVSFPKADFMPPDDLAWTVSRPTAQEVVFRAENQEVAIEKRYRLEPQRFRLRLDIVVENKTERAVSESLAVHLYGRQDPAQKGGSFLSYAEADVAEMVCFVGEKPERATIESLVEKPSEHVGNVRWIAADQKFFTLALLPHPETPVKERKCGQRALEPLLGEVFVSFASRTIAPGAATKYEFTVFGGPKYTDDLDPVRPGGQDVHFVEVVNVSFAVLARPLLYLLKTFHGLSGNWGVAIILLTLFVKLVTFYPTQRSLMSAKKMQKLAPKLAALRTKYQNDRQRMGVETMSLYKSNGVSPFGGCLPALIQMPIWIALFSTLNYAVELHRSSFMLHINDLSAKDPFYITPLLMGGIMYVQMRMSPAGVDPQQQKMMAIMMPLMFTVFSLFLPAGLAIYTLTSYLLGIAQQLLVNYLDRRANRGALAQAPG